MRLFPAHAGVIRLPVVDAAAHMAVPRTRGGDPPRLRYTIAQTSCSPHTRG